MKRLLMVLLAVSIFVASMGLSGCGGKKDAGPTAQPAKEESLADIVSKGKKLTGLNYDYVMTVKDGQMTGQMWVEGKKMRSEAMMQNRKIVSIVDGEANVAYSYMPEQGVAMKIPLDKAKTADTPDRYTKDLDTKARLLETVQYDGVRCRVLLIQSSDGKTESKIWLREDYGIPARVETNTSDGNKTVMEYKNIKAGPIPADMFKLPAGVKVTDIGGMMQQLPQKP